MAPEIQTGPIVEISADALRVIVRAEVTPDDLGDAARSILAQMRELRVCEAALALDVEAVLDEWLKSEGVRTSRVLFEGTPPGPPTNGRLEWARDFFVTGFELDAERDVVDYRRRLDERSVKKDELLCTVAEAVDGEPGVDVYGQPIRGAKAKHARIRIGPNVTTPDGRSYYATCDGRIRWHRGTLSVDDVYVIDGGVNLRTGHVRHPGTLVVNGDVERDSMVVAEKDVDVRGMVDGGSVYAGGEIVVRGGIVGHGESVVEAGGAVRAAYMLDARVRSKGDITVGREIVQSQVTAHGAVHISQGRIAGGVVSAGNEVVAAVIGTEGAVKTAVHVAEPQDAAAERAALEKRLTELHEQREQIAQIVNKLGERAADLPPDKRAALDKLTGRLSDVEVECEACQEELDEFSATQPTADSRIVRILRRIHPEAVLNINGDVKKITHAIEGPLTARSRAGEVHIFAD